MLPLLFCFLASGPLSAAKASLCNDCDVSASPAEGAASSVSWQDVSGAENDPAASTTETPQLPGAPPIEYTIRTEKSNITVNGTRTKFRGVVRCGSPCRCGSEDLARCPEGVSLVRDGCNCCKMCARQQGDTCDAVHVCDSRRQLHCVYPDRNASRGICKVVQGQWCQVEGGGRYMDGDNFKLDCRTQCSCQNGTYGCVSLCPHEAVRPSAECYNARLVRLRGNCCREWLCDHDLLKQPPGLVRATCERRASEWGPCSATCGVGVSVRVVTSLKENACSTLNETRLCTVRPCDDTVQVPVPEISVGRTSTPRLDLPGASETATAETRHRTRRNHLCRATVRAPCAVRLTDGFNCSSVALHTPRYCGSCPGRRCCFPVLSTTVRLPFVCFEDGAWTTRVKDVMSIVRCQCKPKC